MFKRPTMRDKCDFFPIYNIVPLSTSISIKYIRVIYACPPEVERVQKYSTQVKVPLHY